MSADLNSSATHLELASSQTSGHRFAERCSRPELSTCLAAGYDDVGTWPTAAQLPVVYSPRYNITFAGFEKLHPFDSAKFKKVLTALQRAGVISARQHVEPKEAPLEALLDVHTEEYLSELHTTNWRVVQVIELPFLLMMPNFLLQWRVVTPMKYHVAGTMLAAALAIERGWSINLGGGMHHASSGAGMGWCPFDDIMLAVRRLRLATQGRIQKVLLLDLDAHQGNGVQRDKLAFNDIDLVIVDMYNHRVFPRDEEAKEGIDVAVELVPGIQDAAYLASLESALQQATTHLAAPHLIIYNAGTDILAGDLLGRLSVSRAGVVRRDEMVWQYALERRAPICHLLSGGYAPDNAAVISESLLNLFSKFNLKGTAPL